MDLAGRLTQASRNAVIFELKNPLRQPVQVGEVESGRRTSPPHAHAWGGDGTGDGDDRHAGLLSTRHDGTEEREVASAVTLATASATKLSNRGKPNA